MSNSNVSRSILDFLVLSEKLKSELRHSYLSNPERQESVAEHSWMAALLAIVLFDHLKEPVDQLKVLKMIIIHDLAEAIVGDVPVFQEEARAEKVTTERAGLKRIVDRLPEQSAREIVELWEEFEARQTPEAKLVKAIDRLEACNQHNLAAIESWEDGDFVATLGYKDHLYAIDSVIEELKDLIYYDAYQKVKAAGMLDRFSTEQRSIVEQKTDENRTDQKGDG